VAAGAGAVARPPPQRKKFFFACWKTFFLFENVLQNWGTKMGGYKSFILAEVKDIIEMLSIR